MDNPTTPRKPLVKSEETPSREPEPPEPFVLAKNGDLQLIVGPVKQVILVHSWPLMNASALLSDAIKDPRGPKPASDGYRQGRTINLVDDDADSWMVLCGILHGKPQLDLDLSDGMLLYKLANLAQKYDCAGPLLMGAEFYFSRMGCLEAVEGLWRCFVAAYYLRSSRFFQRIGSQLAVHYRFSFLVFASRSINYTHATRLCCE